ncbi:MAG: DUF3048 domain-containing protein [Oscillospiraceae bacterium]|nr:DUF3048 domain-containing protein [Oscillospiraceae bacterium]
MKKRLLPFLVLLLLLTACGEEPEPTPTPTPAPEPTATLPPSTAPETPEPTPYNGPVNPLTGAPIEEAWVNRRPVAVMINNLREALPQHGVSKADIIYEVPTEGGITRMLALYQCPKGAGTIGSIRSARPYYLELALGHDAIFIHAGGSEKAYSYIRSWGVTSLDGVRGPYLGSSPKSNLLWRDPERRKHYSLEHTVVTEGEHLAAKLEEISGLRLDHREGYQYIQEFSEDGTPLDGVSASELRVHFSNYKTGIFTYDAERKCYLVEEYGAPYIDGNTDEQVGMTNVLVLKTACRNTGDSYGHITVDLSSGGSGYFACGGQLVDITWSKTFPDGQLHYSRLDGTPLILGQGSTYICIIPSGEEVAIS